MSVDEQTDVNIYVGNGERSHRMHESGAKTLCGIYVVKAAKQLASDGEPGCIRCYDAMQARARSVAEELARDTQANTYADGAGLGPGLHRDPGVAGGHSLVGDNGRRIIVTEIAGEVWIGGVSVTDPAVLSDLSTVLRMHARNLAVRGGR
jgi:hypothetical protein